MERGARRNTARRWLTTNLLISCAVIACLIMLTSRPAFITLGSRQFSFSIINVQSQQPLNTQTLPEGVQIQADDFIKVDDFWLRNSKGRPHFIQGMNYWSCMNLAAPKEAGGDQARLLLELDQMAAAGINHLRIMAASQGAKLREPFRILPALQNSPNHFDERIFSGLDMCIAEAGKRGMRLTLVLGNTWQWTGGHAQLYAWSSGRAIPYPRSWNMSLDPQRSDGYIGWGNWTAGSNEFTRFQAQFYTDDEAKRIYKAHLDQVLHRKNTVNGRKYNEDATIMTWEPVNEPTSATQRDEDRQALNDWYSETTHYIKAAAPKQLVTTGYEAKQSQEAFNEIHNSTAIDYSCAHMWPQIWGYYDMLNSSTENVQAAIDWSQVYIMKVQSYSRNLGKPILLEEFGMPRDNWVNDVGVNQYLYDTSAPTTSRDAIFKAISELVTTQFKSKRGLIGLAPWSYGGIYRSASQHYNNQGILIAGDPPQEPPGWLSILDTDHAMILIAQMHHDIKSFLSTAV